MREPISGQAWNKALFNCRQAEDRIVRRHANIARECQLQTPTETVLFNTHNNDFFHCFEDAQRALPTVVVLHLNLIGR